MAADEKVQENILLKQPRYLNSWHYAGESGNPNASIAAE